MHHLNRCIAAEIRIVGQHPAEHRDIGRPAGPPQNKLPQIFFPEQLLRQQRSCTSLPRPVSILRAR
nr:hypothetical protein [Rhodovulum sulfidophilum]